MKKIYFIFLFFTMHCVTANAQSPSWLWAKSSGKTSAEYGRSIAADVNGNVLVTGIFYSNTITLGTSVFINAGTGFSDFFLAKYDASGNLLWAKSAGGAGADAVNDIVTDNSGNIYLTGYFMSDTITFGTDTLINSGNRDVYIVKYDTSGNVMWAKSAVGDHYDEATGMSTDGSGNVLVTGRFYSKTVTFGTSTLTNTTSIKVSDVFVVKYDASGNVIWVNSAGGTDNDGGADIVTDGSGNVLITGSFVSLSFLAGPDTLINSGAGLTSDIFIIKYDASGNVLWADSPFGAASEGSYGIAADDSGNAILTGFYNSPVIIFGSDTLTNTSVNDIFVVKYDPSGNALWARSAGGNSDDDGYGIAADANGNVLVTGLFKSDSISFGTSALINSSVAAYDIFIVKYDVSGNVMWTKSAGGPAFDYGTGIATDNSGNILVTGSFASSSLNLGTTTLINTGVTGTFDFFVARMDSTIVYGIEEEKKTPDLVTLYPNPGKGQITIACFENMSEIKISNMTGQIIYHTKPDEKDISLQLDVGGVYFVQVTMKDQTVTKKLVVSR